MKAISLWQPWASLIAVGAKKIETRAWQTSYRGPLAIYANRKVPDYGRELFWTEPFFEALSPAGYGSPLALPGACIVAVAELDDVIQVPHLDMVPYLNELEFWRDAPVPDADSPEWHFGDFRPGRYLFLLDRVRRLSPPIPARGRQRIWDWDEAGWEPERLVVP